MATAAISAFGSTFKWNAVALAELTNISYNGSKVEQLDVSSHDSTGQNREYVAGWGDAGEITIEGNYIAGDTTGQIAFATDAVAKTTREWIITAPNSVFSLTGNGFVSQAPSLTFSSDGAIKFTASIKISGTVTVAISASANLTALAGIEETAGAALVFLPAFAAAKKTYNCTCDTASTWVKITPTLAGATIKVSINGVYSQTVNSGIQTTALACTDAAITKIDLDVIETGKVANRYTVNIYIA